MQLRSSPLADQRTGGAADVLYLSVGVPQAAHRTFGTPEAHAVRCSADDAIFGITLVNVRALLERDELGITIPQAVAVRSDEIALVVAP